MKLENYEGPGRQRWESWSIFTLPARSLTHWKYTEKGFKHSV